MTGYIKFYISTLDSEIKNVDFLLHNLKEHKKSYPTVPVMLTESFPFMICHIKVSMNFIPTTDIATMQTTFQLTSQQHSKNKNTLKNNTRCHVNTQVYPKRATQLVVMIWEEKTAQ